jgi:acetyl esterase/lipase
MIILRAAKVLDTPYEWQANATMAGNAGLSTPLNAESHAGLPPAILVTNGFDPLRDVGHAYARKLAAAGNDLTYVHNPNLTHGFPQFTRSSAACHQATLELADLIKTKIG